MTRITEETQIAQAETEASAEDRVAAIRRGEGYETNMPAFGWPEAVALTHLWGVTNITTRGLKYAKARRELTFSLVLGRTRWSEDDLRNWLVSMRRVANDGRPVNGSHTSGGDAE